MNVEVYAPDQYSGDLMGDLSSRRGRISGSETRGHNVMIKGKSESGSLLTGLLFSVLPFLLFLVLMIAFAMTGMALTVLTGWGGQVSLGQFAFVGLGAYVATLADGLGILVMLVICGLLTAAASAGVRRTSISCPGNRP